MISGYQDAGYDGPTLPQKKMVGPEALLSSDYHDIR